MQRRHAHGPEGLHSESSSGSSSVKLFLPRNLSATSSGLASSLALTDGMNPSVNSTEEQGDPTWPSDQGWDHSNAAICCGIDSRPFQANRLANRLDWDWESPMILAQNSTTGCVGSDQDGDCKPNIMQADPIAAGLRHYNGLLSANIPSNLSHNAWGLLNAAGIRNGAVGMESSSPCFPASSTPLYAGLASSGIVGFPTGIGSYGEARSPYEQQRHLLGLVGMDQRRYQDIVKREAYSTADFSARLGLNLGERAYFPLDDSTFGRFGKRLRPNSPGAQAPMCQAEGCKADLSVAKHYHRRHKVCELHSKAATVLIAGQTQRFCQQCSRFHVLSEFDEGKRSCRKRLADHNRRRRKPQPNAAASGSSTAESTAPRNEEEESVTGSNQNGNQAEGFTGSDQAQALVSAISLASSSPPLVQNGKTQPPVHSPSNEKETYQQYLQGGQSSPSLSLSTLGGGGIVTSEQQSSTQNFGGFDVPVSWLRTVSSKSNLIDAAPRPSMNMPHVVSDKGSPNTKFVETTGSSSSIMPALPHSLQNLMPLPASSDLITGSSNWVLKTIADQSNEQLTEFRSPKLNLHGKSEGQEVLSLLDVGTARKVEATESQIQQTLQAPLELLHHHFPSTVKMNGSTNGHSVNGNNDLKFPGLQGLNPFSRSIFNGRENIL